MTKLKLLGCSVIGVMAIASLLLANNSSLKNEKSINMSNIEALHASAGGEMTCDQKNKNECTIEFNGAIGKSTGFLIATWD